MKRYFRKITSPNPINTYLRIKKYYYNTLSFFIPIYKLNLKSGEVELLLTEANIEIDEERGVAFLPSYSVYKNFNNNYYNYFFIFSKKHIQESSFIKSNHFNYDYLNEILKIEPTNILKMHSLYFNENYPPLKIEHLHNKKRKRRLLKIFI